MTKSVFQNTVRCIYKCVQNRAEVYFLHQYVVPGDKMNIFDFQANTIKSNLGIW